MSQNKLSAKYKNIGKLSIVDIYQMYSIYSKYYKNTKWKIFLNDLSKKSGAFVIRRKSDKKIVGFSTVVNYPIQAGGKKAIGVFSGDTIIEREYWGARVLQVAFYQYMVRLKITNPFKDVYWLLISKGFKTYLLLSNNVEKYYPNKDSKYHYLSDVVNDYCNHLFPEYYNSDEQILDFGERYQCLKEGVAEIDEGMILGNEKISFFEKCNPQWRRGTELPCVGVIDWALLFGYIKKYFNKPVSQGRIEVLQKEQAKKEILKDNELRTECRKSA